MFSNHCVRNGGKRSPMFCNSLVVVLFGIISLVLAPNIAAVQRTKSVKYLQLRPDKRTHWFKVGDNSNLNCIGAFNDNLYSDFRWLDPQGLNITNDKSAPIHVKDVSNGLQLKFVSPSPAESGHYSCEAFYKGNFSVEISATVNFGDPVSSEDCPPIQDLIAGQNGIIRCGGSKDNILSVVDPNGSLIPMDFDRFAVTRTRVEFYPVLESDAGTYEFSVSSKHVMFKYSVEVRVQRPSTISQPQTVTTTTEAFDAFLSLEDARSWSDNSDLHVQSHTIFVVAILSVVVLVSFIIFIDTIHFYYSRKGFLHRIRRRHVNGHTNRQLLKDNIQNAASTQSRVNYLYMTDPVSSW